MLAVTPLWNLVLDAPSDPTGAPSSLSRNWQDKLRRATWGVQGGAPVLGPQGTLPQLRSRPADPATAALSPGPCVPPTPP